MALETSITKLTPVQLLIELDNPESPYQYNSLLAELKNRNYSEEELLKFKKQKDFTLDLKRKKAEEPLSWTYKIFLLAVPFTDAKNAFPDVPTAIEEYEAFYESAGYQRKMKEIKKFRLIGTMIWVAIFVLAYLYAFYFR